MVAKASHSQERAGLSDRAAGLSEAAVHTDVPTYLLTNNPRRWEFDPDKLADWIEETAAGHLVEGSWSTGSTKRIKRGDRAFLLRQGTSTRGIFASGTFVRSVYGRAHWNGDGGTANYADVEWDTVLDPDQALPIATLFTELPDGQWEPRSSGRLIKPEIAEGLEQLWADHVGKLQGQCETLPRSAAAIEGQGRQLDAKLRKEIEDLAQDRLMQHYMDDGWQVEDRRYGNSYDARATKDSEVMYLEAKGTVTTGERVIVTRGEVEWANLHPGECVLGIVSGISVVDGAVDHTSGTLRLYEWEPDNEDLEPLTFDYSPPPDSGLCP